MKAHRNAAETGGITDFAPVPSVEASADPADADDGEVGLSRTASNHGVDTPPGGHPENLGKSGALGWASGHPKDSAALEGAGAEDAKKGYLIENL
jgi:hypothetical protein